MKSWLALFLVSCSSVSVGHSEPADGSPDSHNPGAVDGGQTVVDPNTGGAQLREDASGRALDPDGGVEASGGDGGSVGSGGGGAGADGTAEAGGERDGGGAGTGKDSGGSNDTDGSMRVADVNSDAPQSIPDSGPGVEDSAADATQCCVTYEPVALYIMMDRSSSMVGVLGDPNSWPNASAAISNFANDPSSTGLDVGLGVFPDMAVTDCGTLEAPCCTTGGVCAQPVVPIGPLPANGANLIQGMQSANPQSSPGVLLTPTECALRGMIDHCIQHQNTTGEQCVAILVTDGAPTLCNGDFAHLTTIVANGLSQGILTFTLGLPGSNLQFLNQLAQAGGTDCDPNEPNLACDLTASSTGFLDALNSIRESVTEVIETCGLAACP